MDGQDGESLPWSSSSQTKAHTLITQGVCRNTSCWTPPPGFLIQYIWESSKGPALNDLRNQTYIAVRENTHHEWTHTVGNPGILFKKVLIRFSIGFGLWLGNLRKGLRRCLLEIGWYWKVGSILWLDVSVNFIYREGRLVKR
jgi:hypothetical protein